MNRRERIARALEGQPVDGVPAAFFTHFPPDCRFGQAAVEKHAEFFYFTGMDLVKIQYERKFPSHPIQRPEDWAGVPRLDLEFFGPQLAAVRGLVERFKAEAPVIVTLYSPLMCAGHVGGAVLNRHLAENPEAVRKGLEIVTESLLVFVRECIRLGVDGFYHSTQGGEARRFPDPRTFVDHVKPFDLQVMEEINQRCSFNVLHICDYHRDEHGAYASLEPFLDYPGHVVNCSLELEGASVTAAEVEQLFGRPFLGGMDRRGPLAAGTEEEARAAARRALAARSPRFLLGADCTVPAGTPWENLRAAIDEAHRFAG